MLGEQVMRQRALINQPITEVKIQDQIWRGTEEPIKLKLIFPIFSIVIILSRKHPIKITTLSIMLLLESEVKPITSQQLLLLAMTMKCKANLKLP